MGKNEFHLDVVSIRLVSEYPILSKEKVVDPKSAIRAVGEVFKELDREVVGVINLKTDGTPINFHVVSMGSVNASIFEPRELLKASILSNAASLVMVHNHPSGDLSPSKQDIQTTDRAARIRDMVGIPLLDHVIVGGDNRSYFSFQEKGMVRYASPIRYATDMEQINIDKVAERSRGHGDETVYRR